MTKKELHLSVVTAVLTFADEQKLNDSVKEGLKAILDERLAPKSGGSRVNLDEVTRKDANGQVTEILCAKSGVWLPANALNFYKQNDGKGIIGTDGASLHRTSFAGNKVFQEHNKAVKATKEAILEDLASGKLSPEQIADLQKKLKAANDSKPDYSSVKPKVKSDEAPKA